MANAARRAIPLAKYANVPQFAPASEAPKPVAVPERACVPLRKIDQADRVLNALDALSGRISARIRELQKRKAAVEARYQRIEDRIITEMQDAGFAKCHGTRVEFAVRDAPAALKVTDESLIPDDYKNETTTTTVDKMAVKKALAAGAEIGGCELTTKVTLCRK